MIASIDINAVCINNVNVRGVAAELITARYREPLARISRIFEAYGVKLFLSLNFASPKRVGGLNTADPCDEGVRAFWRERISDLFENVPNFGGFVVKADSRASRAPSPMAARTPTARTCSRNLRVLTAVLSFGAALSITASRTGVIPKPTAPVPATTTSSATTGIRGQRHPANQNRPDGLSGARAGASALRRPEKDEHDA